MRGEVDGCRAVGLSAVGEGAQLVDPGEQRLDELGGKRRAGVADGNEHRLELVRELADLREPDHPGRALERVRLAEKGGHRADVAGTLLGIE